LRPAQGDRRGVREQPGWKCRQGGEIKTEGKENRAKLKKPSEKQAKEISPKNQKSATDNVTR